MASPAPESSCVVGVLHGEGIGPEVVAVALRVLSALQSVSPYTFEVRHGGPIGQESERRVGKALSDEVADFCEQVFSDGGAVLAGPGGGRFVYDLRRRFDLFCKISPLVTAPELRHAGRLKERCTEGVDILVVRENISGIYHGSWTEGSSVEGGRMAGHSFSYSERQVRRILTVAARLARERRGELAVAVKNSGVPSISKLWSDCAREVGDELGVSVSELDVDYAAFRLVQHAQQLDVLVAPNLFGDILSDLGGVLLGSRGLTYGGNFASGPAAVYQTNHGAAHDLAGSDRANPVGQVFALAMLLRESFGLIEQASLVERAVRAAWQRGWRTADLAEDGCRPAGTREMGEMIAQAVIDLAARPS